MDVAIIIEHETVIGEGETAIVKGLARIISAHPATVAEVMNMKLYKVHTLYSLL